MDQDIVKYTATVLNAIGCGGMIGIGIGRLINEGSKSNGFLYIGLGMALASIYLAIRITK